MGRWDNLINQLHEFAFFESQSMSDEEYAALKNGGDIVAKYNK